MCKSGATIALVPGIRARWYVAHASWQEDRGRLPSGDSGPVLV